MIKTIYNRKRKISNRLKTLNSAHPTSFSHDQMCFSYVLVYGAIEFMIETIIRGWIKHYVDKHKFHYQGKKHVDYIIQILQKNAETRLDYNNTVDYDKICKLIEIIAGKEKREEFKNLLKKSSSAGTHKVKTTLEKISQVRHRLAHGIELPEGISPNINELEEDFEFLYANLIKNLDFVFPRK